jgi:hypothetical protein
MKSKGAFYKSNGLDLRATKKKSDIQSVVDAATANAVNGKAVLIGIK